MKTKAALTSAYIVETVAPIFNKLGYEGTSMAQLAQATGLTKGALYGNFKNKEDLAFASFKFNVTCIVDKIKSELVGIESGLEQLHALMNFYRTYRLHTIKMGGCPIINIGVDANYQNPGLLERVQEIVIKLQGYIQRMIELGQAQKEIHEHISAKLYAKRIFAFIEGSIFMTVTMNDDSYINDMMNHVDNLIDTELKR
jgi:TetR/AcrR family transcriptional repressor of nem operon